MASPLLPGLRLQPRLDALLADADREPGYGDRARPRRFEIAAERLGFNSVWTAEAYGSDALTPLAWWGASTEKMKLGTAIMQMGARTPAATAGR